jgi:membrane-associated phospholipid phosphatase
MTPQASRSDPHDPARTLSLWNRAGRVFLAATLLVTASLTADPPADGVPPSATTTVTDTIGVVQAQTRPGFVKVLADDLTALIVRPAHLDSRDWVAFGLSAVAIAAASSFDRQTQTEVGTESNRSSGAIARSIRPIGTWGGVAAMGAAWIVGKSSGNQSLMDTTADGLEASIIAAGIITPLLKAAVGRSRPPSGTGNRQFHPFSSGASFPSGESTEAFALASVIAARTDNRWIQGTAWTLAGLVAWERIRLNGHWTSDVVAGALIGTGVGRWIVHRHQGREHDAASWSVQPAVYPRGAGFRVAINLK